MRTFTHKVVGEQIPDSALHIALLGPPLIVQNGQSFPLARRQSRALLYRIAASPHPVPRDQLCFLLWPDSVEVVARRNLTVLLAQIRRVLPDILLPVDDAVSANRAHVWSDTVVFNTMLPQALRDGRLDLLADVAALYRGPFLNGFSLPDSAEYEHWMEGERQSWERRYLDTLAALVEGYTAHHDYQAAIENAQRALATDELAEDMHRRLIELYAAIGDRSAALRQFERCVVVLERELGVAPLPETRAVYEAIRDGNVGQHALTIGVPPQTHQHNEWSEQERQATPTTLPFVTTTLFGRTEEIAHANALLHDSSVRLLTLNGPGGSGKTRLAIEIASRLHETFADGVVFVALAPLRDPALVLGAIGQACGLQGAGTAPLVEQVRGYLRDKQLLLVIDNCEHLLAAAPVIGDVISSAPGVRVLATSRSVLNLQGEHTLAVPPLPLPNLAQLPSIDELAEQPAVALLLARTRAMNPRFQLTEDNAADVAALCHRLDGLPLAIDLAAARLKLIAPRALLKRLDQRLALLTRGPQDVADRQQTLRATIDWSYRLLDADERALFDCLAVFAGSWTLEAAEAVCGIVEQTTTRSAMSLLDNLASLVDKSLVQQTVGADGESRFYMLETIREYAYERLTERNLEAFVAEAHAAYFEMHAGEAATHLRMADATDWLARLDDNHPNILAALNWFYNQNKRHPLLRLINALGPFWFMRGLLHEGCDWVERTLAGNVADAMADRSTDPTLLAEVYGVAAQLFILLGDYATAVRYESISVELWRKTDNEGKLALALITLGAAYGLNGEYVAANEPLAEGEALAKQIDDEEIRMWLALADGRTARHRGKPQEARDSLESALAYCRQRGDMWFVALILLDLTSVVLALGDAPTAEAYAAEALGIARSMKSQTGIANALNDLGEIARYHGKYEQGEAYYKESLHLLRRIGNRADIPRLLHNLGYVSLHKGDSAHADELFRESLALFRAQRIDRGMMECLAGLASIAAVRGEPLRAARLWGAAEAICADEGWTFWPPDQVEHEQFVHLARSASDAITFDAAWQAGRQLSLEQALGRDEG